MLLECDVYIFAYLVSGREFIELAVVECMSKELEKTKRRQAENEVIKLSVQKLRITPCGLMAPVHPMVSLA